MANETIIDNFNKLITFYQNEEQTNGIKFKIRKSSSRTSEKRC